MNVINFNENQLRGTKPINKFSFTFILCGKSERLQFFLASHCIKNNLLWFQVNVIFKKELRICS